ncbi:hypothetical protein [Muricoccus vinaceus]|uniref:DUF222 domain-containing protein n=1 Tax=Muricoccus vinaceus TaxID=424704 RepID=A0ABV6IL20_9PROT
MDYDLLRAELASPAYDGLSDQAVADALNARTIPVAVDVPTSDARGLLLGTGEWGALCILAERQTSDPTEMMIRAAAITARDSMLHTTTLETSRPLYLGAVTQMLGALVMAQAISADSHAALLAMTQSSRSRAEELGLPVVTDQDVLTVRVTIERELNPPPSAAEPVFQPPAFLGPPQ